MFPSDSYTKAYIASAATIGESLIIVLILQPSGTSVLFTLFLSMFLANAIAALASWQLHSYKRRGYEDFLTRNEMQEALEKYSKHLEEEVAERSEKLKNAERFAAIGATAGMVGHDLRNPLTGISSAAYYLKKKYGAQMDEKGNEMLQIIEENVNYSNKIIGDLLEYSRNITLELTATNPNLVVADALSMITFPTNISVVNSTEESLKIEVDLVKIKRVFVNLAKNAVDAMPQGGQLTVKSEKDEDIVTISYYRYRARNF